ncbi:TRAP transporter small permease [Brevibacterium album]|uniref:TRAP transporter small permease n=1 Tax=Brevibacterium album TaxID=417948 RepID=UPI0005534C82|nr:TRAP transporter small permease [Brevibacterium album]
MLKTVRALERVLSGLAALALIALIVLSVSHALGRTFFGAPVHGANEIAAQWLLPIIVLFAIPSAQVWKEHYVVTIATERMGPRSLSLLKLIGFLAGAALCAGLAWYGFEEALKKAAVGATAGITSLPVWPFHFLVPIGMTVCTLVFVLDALLAFRHPEDDLNTGTGRSINVDPEEEVL